MFTPTPNDFIAVLPEIVLTISAGLILLVEAFLPRWHRTPCFMALLALGGAAWCRLTMPLPGTVWNGMLEVGPLAAYVDIYILAASFLTVLIAGPFLRRTQSERGEFYALLLLAIVGAMTMACSVDALPMFLGLELLSLPLYALNAFLRKSHISVEAGLKYFIVGAFASAFVVYGIALLYGSTATTNLLEMGRAIATSGSLTPITAIGIAMLVGGLGFKLALFPFHGWAPDVYQGAPTPITAFLSVVPKGAALIVLYRFVDASDLLRVSDRWLLAAGIIAVGSQFIGNIVAIAQRDIKRMLAYSGIAHMGYVMVAIIVSGDEGGSAILVYLAAYTLMNMGAFAAVSRLSEREDETHSIDAMAGQGWSRPVIALALTVCLFSLAGIPPLVGFTGKFVVFRAAVNGGFIWLAVLGVINSLISAFYYLRVVYVLYMQPLPSRAPAFPASFITTATAAVAALAVLVAGLFPAPLLQAAEEAVKNLVR
ncbi:MAG: NADH-quinone oxidoreductase subunit N [bacterium]|nr:NADH-quinone oxidoreductase subunit N [bacterium]